MTTEVTVKVRRIAPAQPFRGIDADLFTQVGTECCLGAKTFIYGRNGTGKTTFAELLRLAGTGELTVTADYWENDRWKQGPIPTSVVRQIHVFNRYYVDDHLAFFLDGSGSSAGILKLGQVNVDAEKARRDLESDIQRQGKRLEDVIAARERLTRRIENSRKSAKQRAIDVLGPALPMKYSTQSFTVADARKALEAAQATAATDVQRAAYDELLRSDEFQSLPLPQDPLVGSSSLSTDVSEVLTRELSSKVLRELELDRALAEWIEAGLNLHPAGDDHCKFCTVGTLNVEVRAAYSAHFDSSLEVIRLDLQELETRLRAFKDALELWMTGFPPVGVVLPDHRTEYSSALDALKEPIDTWRTFLETLAGLVSRRINDPHRPIQDDLPATPEPLPLVAMTKAVASHNADVHGQAGLRAQAERMLLGHAIEPYRSEFQTAVRKIPLAERAIERIRARIGQLQGAAHRAHDRQHDVGGMAELIDHDLADLGHLHLSLRVTEDGKGYRVQRSNGPAEHLSEGERHALALLYFLRSLEADGVVPERDLVVVDDPVTSLDKDAMFAAYSLVDERTRRFGQAIVLTHDYELFRLFLMRHGKALKASRGDIRKGVANEIRFPRVQFLESRARELPSGERGICLRPMPSQLLDRPH